MDLNEERSDVTYSDSSKSLVSKTRQSWMAKISTLFNGKVLNDDIWDDLEEGLILADVGASIALDLIEKVRSKAIDQSIDEPSEVFEVLKSEVSFLLATGTDYHEIIKTFQPSNNNMPIVILFVGVNGVGKTTTLAKMAHLYIKSGNKVIIGAADTFRAAAIDQIKIWGDRLDLDVIAHSHGSDPSAVVFDTIEAAKARKADVVLIDTAGRMHNSINLMDELNKMSRVVAKTGIGKPKTILVLDASTGQNGLQQASAFLGSMGCDGIVLTKLDGSSKGGIILSIYAEFKMPVLYVGSGENLGDLDLFDPNQFAQDLFCEPS